LIHHARFDRGRKREPEVKNNKVLLLGSFAAMILSAALLITPARASVSSHCTNCSKLINGTTLEVADCKVTGVDGCFCPLTPPLFSNNCFFVGADKPQR